MKKAAQCSCGRSAVKVNWPWTLSMSRHPGGGQRGRGLRLQPRRCWPRAPLSALPIPGSASPRAQLPASAVRLPRSRAHHSISPQCASSGQTFNDGNPSQSLPGDALEPPALSSEPRPPHLPAAAAGGPSPAAPTHAERGGRAALPPAPASGWR